MMNPAEAAAAAAAMSSSDSSGILESHSSGSSSDHSAISGHSEPKPTKARYNTRLAAFHERLAAQERTAHEKTRASGSCSSDSATSSRKRKAKRGQSEPKPTGARYNTRLAARNERLAAQERIAYEQTRASVLFWDLPDGTSKLYRQKVKAFRLEYHVTMKKHAYKNPYRKRKLTYEEHSEAVKLSGIKLLQDALGKSCGGWPYDVYCESSYVFSCYLSKKEMKRVRAHKDVESVEVPITFLIW